MGGVEGYVVAASFLHWIGRLADIYMYTIIEGVDYICFEVRNCLEFVEDWSEKPGCFWTSPPPAARCIEDYSARIVQLDMCYCMVSSDAMCYVAEVFVTVQKLWLRVGDDDDCGSYVQWFKTMLVRSAGYAIFSLFIIFCFLQLSFYHLVIYFADLIDALNYLLQVFSCVLSDHII